MDVKMSEERKWNGKAVQLRRVAKSLTIVDLCTVVNDSGVGKVDKSTVHRWEKGYEPRNPDHRHVLATALGCSVLSFYRFPKIVDDE